MQKYNLGQYVKHALKVKIILIVDKELTCCHVNFWKFQEISIKLFFLALWQRVRKKWQSITSINYEKNSGILDLPKQHERN